MGRCSPNGLTVVVVVLSLNLFVWSRTSLGGAPADVAMRQPWQHGVSAGHTRDVITTAIPHLAVTHTVCDTSTGPVGAVWCTMDPLSSSERGCFTPELLQSLNRHGELMGRSGSSQAGREPRYPHDVAFHILASSGLHLFNRGGDLRLFYNAITAAREAIRHDNAEDLARAKGQLIDYGRACIRILHANVEHFGRSDLETISLVQGDALGGGLESALSSDTVFVEQGSTLALPETLFQMFPGMGALSFLARRVGLEQAVKLILERKLPDLETLQQLGVIDFVVPSGGGERAIFEYIKAGGRTGRSAQRPRLSPESSAHWLSMDPGEGAEGPSNGARGLYEAARVVQRSIAQHPGAPPYGELEQVVMAWVDTAMRLADPNNGAAERALKMMKKLFEAQER